MLRVSTAGKKAMLRLITAAGLTIHLVAREMGDTAEGALREPKGGGYAPKKLVPGSWAITGDAAVYPDVAFVFSGATSPDVIYGYAVKLGNIVLWVEPLPQPFPVAIKGDTLVITPTFALSGM